MQYTGAAHDYALCARALSRFSTEDTVRANANAVHAYARERGDEASALHLLAGFS